MAIEGFKPESEENIEELGGRVQDNETRFVEDVERRERLLGIEMKMQNTVESFRDFQKAKESAEKISNNSSRSRAFREIAKAEAEAGLFKEAKESAGKISDDSSRSIAFSEIAKAEAEAGLSPKESIQKAKESAEKISDDYYRSRAFREIAKAEAEAGLSLEEIEEIPRDDLVSILRAGRDKSAHAIGYFRSDIREDIPEDIPKHILDSFRLGVSERKDNTKEVFEVSSGISNNSSYIEKRALSRSLLNLDYSLVSDQLIQKVNAEKDLKSGLRYLKTLIEIENPKGRTIATRLYIHPKISDGHKEYLLRKLISSGHWGESLGEYLKESLKEGKSKEEIDNIVTAIIKDLNLIPDETVYRALEEPGLLEGKTLEERVLEIKEKKDKFDGLNRDELLLLFREDEDAMKIYYLLNGGEYRYSLINDYTYDKFKLIIRKINEVDLDERKINRFKHILEESLGDEEEAEYILKNLREGRFPYMEEGRTFSINTMVEEGGEYSKALHRLQETWNLELKRALLASLIGERPSNARELQNLELKEEEILQGKSGKVKRIRRYIDNFNIGEKQSEEKVLFSIELMRKELIQRARQMKDKEERDKLQNTPSSDIALLYFKTFIPELEDSTFFIEEWKSHIKEVLTALEKNRSEEKKEGKDMTIEATFLDKGEDFIRSVRFADGQQCCFNSGNYTLEGDLGSADWIARLNKDPLSFLIDLKPEGSNEITGFVFGRMGIDEESGRLIVMLNGIYSQYSSPAFVNNLLELIKEKFAERIGAESILLASKYGGTLTALPDGYRETKRKVEAIRGIDEEQVYDDIGNTANGTFTFEGYEKSIL